MDQALEEQVEWRERFIGRQMDGQEFSSVMEGLASH